VPHPDGIIKTPFKRGVFQGDPLSVILFLLAINPVLWRLEEEDAKACGFKIAHPTRSDISNQPRLLEKRIYLGFCDDINLVANDDKGNGTVQNTGRGDGLDKMSQVGTRKCKGMLVGRSCTPRKKSEGLLTIKRPNATFKGIQVGQLQGVASECWANGSK
jgi:hypothetical protein